jgi:hypothetical protein
MKAADAMFMRRMQVVRRDSCEFFYGGKGRGKGARDSAISVVNPNDVHRFKYYIFYLFTERQKKFFNPRIAHSMRGVGVYRGYESFRIHGIQHYKWRFLHETGIGYSKKRVFENHPGSYWNMTWYQKRSGDEHGLHNVTERTVYDFR